MGEPQAVHCGPWFCASSRCCSPQFGALSSPTSHPAEADFIGSPATTSFCTELHLGHSNRRCSKPIELGLMLASIMRIVQCEQRGRLMDLSDGPEEKLACGMALPCIGRERAALSVTDSCRRRGADENSLRFPIRESVVNIAQSSPTFHELSWGSTGWTGTVAVQEACLCTTGCHRPRRPMNSGLSIPRAEAVSLGFDRRFGHASRYRREAAPTTNGHCDLRAVFPKVISGLRRPIAIQAATSLNMNLPE